MMDCSKYEAYCSAYLDNELTADEQAILLGHISNCAHCAAYLEHLRTLRSRLSYETVLLPKALHDTVMDAVLKEAQATVVPLEKRRHFPVFSMLAAAVIVVLLVTTGKLGDSLWGMQNPFDTVTSTTNAVANNPAQAASAAQDQMVTDSADAALQAPATSSKDAAASSAIVISEVPNLISTSVYAYCYVAQNVTSIPDFGGTLLTQSPSGEISYFALDNNMSTLEKALGILHDSGFEAQSRTDVGGVSIDTAAESGLIILIQSASK